MNLVKIVTTLGYFQVGRDYVIHIEVSEHNPNHYVVTKEGDTFNKGTTLVIKCTDVIEYWD